MAEVKVDIADKTPKYVADITDLKNTDYLITMGCSITKFNPAQYGMESHEWDLVNPDGQDMETVREVRDEIERRVETLFNELERIADEKRASADYSGGVITAIRDSLSF